MKRVALFVISAGLFAQPQLAFLNHGKPVLDAHNCYPYEGQWTDRIERALGTGFPVGIEQDLAWFGGRVVVSHTADTKGTEPTLKEHFFEPVRPIVEKALKENDRSKWPLIIVHFDVKDNRPELHHDVWELLGEYETWITTARKSIDPTELTPLEPKPVLVLTEDNDAQEEVFFNQVPVGAKLRVFGSAHTNRVAGASDEERAHFAATTPPEELLSEKPSNYRRWWNNSWWEVEEGGQRNAGEWSPHNEQRLRALVGHAHRLGFWIRFYTLDGFTPAENRGWDQGYNFGSQEAALLRWNAAIQAGVDLIATDQYENLAAVMSPRKTAVDGRRGRRSLNRQP